MKTRKTDVAASSLYGGRYRAKKPGNLLTKYSRFRHSHKSSRLRRFVKNHVDLPRSILRPPMLRSVASISAWTAHAMAWAAGLWLAFGPVYQGVEATLPGESGSEVTRLSATMVEVNGLYVIPVAARACPVDRDCVAGPSAHRHLPDETQGSPLWFCRGVTGILCDGISLVWCSVPAGGARAPPRSRHRLQGSGRQLTPVGYTDRWTCLKGVSAQ